jgi:hypothetical protein
VEREELSMRVVCLVCAGLVAGLAVATPVFATIVTDVPEISPGSISAGLGVLAAGVLIVRSRLRRK